jgi:hypothetical protein
MDKKNCLFNFRVNRDIKDRFLEVCAISDRSAGDVFNKVMIEEIKKHEKKGGNTPPI